MWHIPHSWRDVLDGALLEKTWNQCKEDKYYPPEDLVLAAFYSTTPKSVKVVLVGQDPFHDGSAMGLCFSVPESRKINPSLRNILKAIHEQFPGDHYKPQTSDLTRWAEDEGVLMINAALTVSPGKPNSHAKYWAAFTNDIIAKLKKFDQPIVWFLWGNFARDMHGPDENTKHLVLRAIHPSPMNGNKFVDYEQKYQSFIRANEFLKKHGVEPVQWLEYKPSWYELYCHQCKTAQKDDCNVKACSKCNTRVGFDCACAAIGYCQSVECICRKCLDVVECEKCHINFADEFKSSKKVVNADDKCWCKKCE